VPTIGVKKMTTRNLYEVAFYRSKGIEAIERETRDRTVYFHYEDTEELREAREAFLELDPVFYEIGKLRSKVIEEIRQSRSGSHD